MKQISEQSDELKQLKKQLNEQLVEVQELKHKQFRMMDNKELYRDMMEKMERKLHLERQRRGLD